MSTPNFYETLPSFRDFHEITADAHFQRAPEDWGIVITDVRGSTRAIEAGRYREVNTIGVASIVVAKKAMKGHDFPFVFGGDGATLLLPPEHKGDVLHDLCALRALAAKNFALDLRVGYVSVSELRTLGHGVEVAKYELTKGKNLAVLRGSGIKIAESKIKCGNANYEVNLPLRHAANLDGLSCRWEPIPSKKGKVLSLLVLSRKDDPKVYQRLLVELDRILPGGLEASNPVNLDTMSYKSVRECVQAERKYHTTLFSVSFALRFLEILAAVAIYKLGVPPLVFDPDRYARSMHSHSDYRKFDDMLKMVIDCSTSDLLRIKHLLQELHDDGAIHYGLFEADNSLMTCFVDGLNDGEHIHFIDADNGGYAAAAVQLKKQMKSETDYLIST